MASIRLNVLACLIFITALISSVYGIPTVLHDIGHIFQENHFHKHYDGITHQHNHSYESETSRKHHHEIEDSNELFVHSLNQNSNLFDDSHFRSLHQINLKSLNVLSGFSRIQCFTSGAPPIRRVSQVQFILPYQTAPPFFS